MGQHQRCRQRHRAAVVVEIVRMLVVADQYRVHRAERVGGDGGAGELGQIRVFPGRIEGRVHHEPVPADVDDRRGTAQHADRTVAPPRVNFHATTQTFRPRFCQ